MTLYKFYYKCRMCGKTYSNSGTGNKDLASQHMVEAVVMHPCDLYDIHYCSEYRQGIADYIGNRKENE